MFNLYCSANAGYHECDIKKWAVDEVKATLKPKDKLGRKYL